ncbi:MAG: electron transport complex subunit RsxC [Gammaproteobacteria bacterium]|nr:electron transport complex subunit RsxC [Gammaproteobacteria bacterium]MCF6231084.1 electron transport complex subunit RsxC [Gammaproteobacteria bacterium]
MIRQLFRYKGGVKLPEHKQESTRLPIQKVVLPKRLTLPLQQHIGSPSTPTVAVGDRVLKGQMIAKAASLISAPVHAPTSGRVVEIGEYTIPHPSGLKAPCIVIETDGNDAWCDHRKPVGDCHDYSPDQIRDHIRNAGVVGLGGAGFPSFLKLTLGDDRVVETLILNGAECEPYITCDDILMRERPLEIIKGLMIMKHALVAKNCVIGIEDNKPEAAAALRSAIKELAVAVQVVEVPTRYPTGGEKQLIKILTGKEIPPKALPIEKRVVVHNVGTAAAVYRAICLGEPLISRIITVTGAIKRPANYEIPFGMSAAELLTQAGIETSSVERIIHGGPMMGFTLNSVEIPLIKTSNCLLVTNKETVPLLNKQQAHACIRCGSCADVCPINLLPQQLFWHSRAKDFDKVQDYNLFDCIECGCCDYVCPSQIPLVQYFRFAKTAIWQAEQEKKQAELAKERHQFRQFRIEREKAEKKARHKAKAAKVAANSSKNGDQKQAIEEAMARVKAKKQPAAEASPEQPKPGGNT